MGGMQVIGVSVTDEAVTAVARRSTRPVVVEWAERVIKRHVRRERSLLTRIKDPKKLEAALAADKVPSEACARIRSAFSAGEPIYTTSKQAFTTFLVRAADTMDWLESLPASDRRIRRIERMAWTDAEKHSEAWHVSIMKVRKKSKGIMEGVRKLLDMDGGSFIAELTTAGSLRAEGSAMGHCVGGYWNRVASGETRILSLRDKDGHPHVTIELNGAPLIQFADGTKMRAAFNPGNGVHSVAEAHNEWVAVQIRGKQNKPPVLRYMKLVEQWLETSQTPWVEYGQERAIIPGTEITVFTTYRRHFKSAEEACEYGEPLLKDELAKGKKKFTELYRASGLAEIHKHEAVRERYAAFMSGMLPAFMEEFAAQLGKGSTFKVAFAHSGLAHALKGIAGGDVREAREKIFAAAVSQDVSEIMTKERVLASVPGGEDLKLYVHDLPLMPLMLLSAGYAEGVEDKAVELVRPHLAKALKRMAAAPSGVHLVRAAKGGVGPDDVRKAFLFCGLAAEYATAVSAIDASFTSAMHQARLELRRARSSGKYSHETINRATNLLAEGYERRIAAQVAAMEPGPHLLVSAKERNARPHVLRRSETPVLKQYSLP